VAALADIVGYRHVYRFGLALFCLASLGCALAPSLPWLIAARTFQGLGGSAIMAIQPALVRSIYPRAQLGRGLGFNTTVVATSLAAGPSLGAALLSITTWPILFAVYVPLGIVSFLLAEKYLPHTTHPPALRCPFCHPVRLHLRPPDLRHRRHGARPSAWLIAAELAGSLLLGACSCGARPGLPIP
jgi:DHA2 family multidrug resistance protein-like MFS transporter